MRARVNITVRRPCSARAIQRGGQKTAHPPGGRLPHYAGTGARKSILGLSGAGAFSRQEPLKVLTAKAPRRELPAFEGHASPSSPFPISRTRSTDADTQGPCRGKRRTTKVYIQVRAWYRKGPAPHNGVAPPHQATTVTPLDLHLRRPEDLASERHCRCGGRGGGEGGEARAARGPAPPSKGVSHSTAKNNPANLADYPVQGAPHQAARRGQAGL